MSATQDFRDGAATGAAELADRLMKCDIWGLRVTGELARQLAKGIAYEYGGADQRPPGD